ncbi:MAG: phosphopantetheine-binding protein [Gemmatimonadota bacterium]|nr:phosphopantetheine-binding protein [Gemmatimonadota bacterium]
MSALHRRFVDGMLAWLNEEAAPEGVHISEETQLFATRLLDSLRVLELIAYTEQAIGAAIPDSQIRMDNFQTVSRIAAVFLREKESGSVAA